MAKKNNLNGMHARRVTADIITYIFLSIMCIVWLLPFFWVYRAFMKVANRPAAVWHHIKLVFTKGKKHG